MGGARRAALTTAMLALVLSGSAAQAVVPRCHTVPDPARPPGSSTVAQGSFIVTVPRVVCLTTPRPLAGHGGGTEAGSGDDHLPFTGFDLVQGLEAAGALVGLGTALALFARRWPTRRRRNRLSPRTVPMLGA